MGAFISLMSSSLAYEDPLIRQQQQAIGAISTTAKAKEIFAEMGRGMWKSGKGFAKVTVLFAGTECVIESVSFFGVRPRRSQETDSISSACAPFGVKCSINLLHRPTGGYSGVRSIGLGTISEMQSQLGLSLGAS